MRILRVPLRWITAFLLVWALGAPLAARAAQASQEENTPPVAYAVLVNRAPRLDGTLNDPLWQRAKPISNFLQREPNEGQPATEKTVVRILYTKKEIFFGIFCHDSDPQEIVASDLRRDSRMRMDDSFEIVIDPTHSERNAYIFQVNPLGTQVDSLLREGGFPNVGWSGIWTSAAHIVPGGWIATIGIPFFTMNLIRANSMNWGFNMRRFIRAKNEEDLWASWRRQYGFFELSQEGTLRGTDPINGGRLLVVKPYVLAGFRHLPPDAAGSTLGSPGMNMRHKAGVDARLGLRSNVVANFTVNTSFATAAADRTQFSLSPYPLFYPETRQFFLENSGIFDFPISFVGGFGGPGGGGGGAGDLLFFSRQIGIDAATGDQVPLNGGAKVTGTLGKYDFGVMDVETRAKGSDPYGNFAVVRLKRSLFGSSYIGVMGIDKRSGDPTDSYNQAGGVDTRLLIHKNIVVTGFAAATRSPGLSGQNSDVGAGVEYTTDWFNVGAGRRKVGLNFNPEVGFLQRNDCLCDSLNAMLRPRPHIRGVREVDFSGSLEHDATTTGQLETQRWRTSVQVRFNNGSQFSVDLASAHAQQNTDVFNIYKNIDIQPGLYHWMGRGVHYSSPQNWPFTFDLSDSYGGYYDGHLNSAMAFLNYRANEHWSFNLNQQWNRFRLPEGNFSVVFGGTGVDYAFSRFFTVSALAQLNTSQTRAVSANIILRWHYKPDSDLYVVYTSGPRFASEQGNSTTINQNQLIVMFTYSFNPCKGCSLGTSGRQSRVSAPAAAAMRPLRPIGSPAENPDAPDSMQLPD